MNVVIRPERKGDYSAIHEMVTLAFATEPEVANIVDVIRVSPGYVPDFTLVACVEDEVVGHIMLSRADLLDEANSRHSVLILSPLAVHPDWQNQGIGAALVADAVARADKAWARLVVLQGSPAYYPRFGFRDSRTLGITMDLPDWAPHDAGMALPLSSYDSEVRGHLIEPPAFGVPSA